MARRLRLGRDGRCPACENRSLRVELDRAKREILTLEAANRELRVERDAADALLGEAMDAALKRSP
jgi:hypothetical protein